MGGEKPAWNTTSFSTDSIFRQCLGRYYSRSFHWILPADISSNWTQLLALSTAIITTTFEKRTNFRTDKTDNRGSNMMDPLPITVGMFVKWCHVWSIVDRTWWSHALTCSVTRPVISGYLFLGSYVNTGLLHPGSDCKIHNSCQTYLKYSWSIPECSDFHAPEMWVLNEYELLPAEETLDTYFDLCTFYFFTCIIKTIFHLRPLFFCFISVYVTASGKHLRHHIAIWFRVDRMLPIPPRSSEAFKWDTLYKGLSYIWDKKKEKYTKFLNICFYLLSH